MRKLLFLLTLITSPSHAGQNIEYLGDGRYKCRGDDCQHFNAQQNQLNLINEKFNSDRREADLERSRERWEYIYNQQERQWENRQQ